MSTSTDEQANALNIQLFQAWIDNRMEFDRTVAALSAAGIGLLVALTDRFAFESAAGLLLYVAAAVAFLGSLAATLTVFRRNAAYLQRVMHGERAADRTLTLLDRIGIACFVLGVALTALLAISVAVDRYVHPREESDDMANIRESTRVPRDSFGKSLDQAGPIADQISRPAPDTAPASKPATPAAQADGGSSSAPPASEQR